MNEIRVPYRSRSDSLLTVGELARQLPPDERATVREIVTGGVEAGWSTVGDLLDRLEAISPAERRALLDRARESAGLPSAAKATHEQRSRLMAAHAGDDVELQLVPGPTGWVDVGAQQIERARAHAEHERRAHERTERLAARAEQLPEIEREARAERDEWWPANLPPERTP